MTRSEITFLNDLETIVRSRIESESGDSYSVQLARSGIKRIAQKVGEEGVELALAAVSGDDDETLDECADLLYHTIVLLAVRGLSLADVADRLQSRHAKD